MLSQWYLVAQRTLLSGEFWREINEHWRKSPESQLPYDRYRKDKGCHLISEPWHLLIDQILISSYVAWEFHPWVQSSIPAFLVIDHKCNDLPVNITLYNMLQLISINYFYLFYWVRPLLWFFRLILLEM